MKPTAPLRTAGAFIALLLVAGISGGCDTHWGLVDEPSSARFVNDLSFPVRLRLCNANDCGSFYPPDETLDPGDTWEVNVSSVGVPSVYAVIDPKSDRLLGCLPLVTPHRRPELRVAVSENIACRKHVDEDRYWPARWEGLKESGD